MIRLTEPEVALIRRILARDPVMNAYALADLQPRYAPHCCWLVERLDKPEVQAFSQIDQGVNGQDAGVVLFYFGLTPPTVLASGDEALIAVALAKAELPDSVYMSVAPAVFALLARYYDFNGDVRPMVRMVLSAEARDAFVVPEPWVLPANLVALGLRLVELTSAHAPSLRALYAQGGEFAPDAFDPDQLDDGTFFGLETDTGLLAAAGGTHITDPAASIAAIGNMYTLPQWRERGLGKTIIAAIVGRLCAGGFRWIVLNVDKRNEAAQRLYAASGFLQHCEYLEGSGRLRPSMASNSGIANPVIAEP